MPKFGPFHARIKIAAEELPEYDIRIDDNEKRVSCWIPSEAGKSFSVCWSRTVSTVDVSGWVKLDGAPVGGKILLKGLTAEVDYSSYYTSSTTQRYFSFSPIMYTDDDAYLNAPIRDFGEIELEIHHVECKGEELFKEHDPFASHDGRIHERSKKLGAHCVRAGALQQVPQAKYRKTTSIEKLVTFIFRYRPLDMLQANGIAPLPPPQETSAQQSRDNNKRKSPGRDDVGIKEELSEEEDIHQRMNKLKEELWRLEARTKKRVKVEQRSHSLLSDDVIDLT